jgi:hypothetical protein
MQSVSETKSENLRKGTVFVFKRRISQIHAPCQWLGNCEEGKCPYFVHAGGNYYCAKGELP